MVVYCGKFVRPLLFLISFLLLGCSNVLVQENSNGIEVALVVEEDAGRLAPQRSVSTAINLIHHVEAWIEGQQGNRLETVEKDFSGSTVLSFPPITPGTVARVFVRISSQDNVYYSGKSDFFTASRAGNHVLVQLNHGGFLGDGVADGTASGEDASVAEEVSAVTEDASTEETELTGDVSTAGEDASSVLAFDSSLITMTVSSRNATANTVTSKGSASGVSVTHNFYGITGSQVQFSLSQEAVNAGMSLYINSGSTTGNASTKFDQGAGTVQYSVQIQRSGEKSTWYYFTVNSVMKPVTVTFTGLEYVYAATGSNKNAEISIYGFTIGGSTVGDTIYQSAAYGGTEIESLKSFNVGVTTMPVTVAPTSNGASVTVDGQRNELAAQTYELSELWNKSSVMWGTYLRLNYTISQS